MSLVTLSCREFLIKLFSSILLSSSMPTAMTDTSLAIVLNEVVILLVSYFSRDSASTSCTVSNQTKISKRWQHPNIINLQFCGCCHVLIISVILTMMTDDIDDVQISGAALHFAALIAISFI